MLRIYSTTPVNSSKFHKELHAEFGDISINTNNTHISVDIDDNTENANIIKDLILAHDKDSADLDEAKSKKISQLWNNVIAKQEEFYYNSDIVEVRGVVRKGTADNLAECTSIKTWLDALYALYYTKKSSIYNANDLGVLNLVDIKFNNVTNPVYNNEVIWS